MPENKNLSLAQQALVLSGRLRSLVREQQALADELSSIAHRLHRLALEIPEEQQPKSDTSSVEKDELLLHVTPFPSGMVMHLDPVHPKLFVNQSSHDLQLGCYPSELCANHCVVVSDSKKAE